jgi:hypothetical protein
MPDPKQMSGIPRPVDDLPNGSLSVRLIKGQLSNNITDYPVELHVGDKVLTVKTDDGGRAQFDNLPAGATLKATATVDGERLESQEFSAPSRGGIRLMLVATDKGAAPAAEPLAPAVAGQVSLGGDTRIVIEAADEVLQVFYLLEVQNSARTPVKPTTPFAFRLPSGAVGSLMEGSSPLAALKGRDVLVDGPFPPGKTIVRAAYELPITSGTVEIEQRFPAALEHLAVLARKTGDMKLTSPLIERQQDFPNEGEIVIGAMGGAVAAGQPIVLTVSELPHHNPAPRWIALSLASGIVLVGAWLAGKPSGTAVQEASRKKLVARRDKLFSELVRLEADYRQGRGDRARYLARRGELMDGLERVYGALDSDDPTGVAA